jgi:hypothetical protein
MLHDYIGPRQRYITCPSQDLIYGFGILDLGREAVVVQVPDFGERFWVYQATDLRTDAFAELGAMYGHRSRFLPGGHAGRQRGTAAADPEDRCLTAVRIRRYGQMARLVDHPLDSMDQTWRAGMEMGRTSALL